MCRLDRSKATSRHTFLFISGTRFWKFHLSVAQSIVVLLTLPLVFALVIVAYGKQTDGNHLVEQAKRAFVEGHFLKARDMFSQASKADPQNAEALYGYARCSHMLHFYNEAVAAYEKALKLAPGDERIWEGYIESLLWGGTIRSDRRLLEQARDEGFEALSRWPDRPSLYRAFLKALMELKEAQEYGRYLESIKERFPKSPVLFIYLQRMKLHAANQAKRQQEADQIKDLIRSELASANQEAISNGTLAPAELYKIYCARDEMTVLSRDTIGAERQGQPLALRL
ncbi:MAG: tetratricopeptide repeat protein [Blastocatellia bacterium]|nr:tetratricopeptide repeat protein [Blastocatellia bacterium]